MLDYFKTMVPSNIELNSIGVKNIYTNRVILKIGTNKRQAVQSFRTTFTVILKSFLGKSTKETSSVGEFLRRVSLKAYYFVILC